MKISTLVPCTTCGHEIAKKAKLCPNCGARKSSGSLAIIGKFFFAMFVLGTVINLIAPTESTNTPNPRKVEADLLQPLKELCYLAIHDQANNPSTVKIDKITGVSESRYDDGSLEILQNFSAKNAFGLETKFIARCITNKKSWI